MYEGRSDEMGDQCSEKFYQYEGQQYESYATVIGQNGYPMSIPYGLFQYAKYQGDPRHAKLKDTLRRGKWTDEEVKLTDRIIETFNAGSLELDPETAGGVTLRSYLSEKLGCDPMRITKKYTGASCLGKRVYHSANTKAPRDIVEAVKVELALLEVKFREKLEKNSRDRLGLEADVDKHLRNQVVSTPSIDAMMMQGPGCRKVTNGGNMGFWPLNEGSSQVFMQSQSQLSSSSSVPGRYSPPTVVPGYSSEQTTESSYHLDIPSSRMYSQESNRKELWQPSILPKANSECQPRVNLSDDKISLPPNDVYSDSTKRKTKKRSLSRFPYSRYYDPPTPKESTKEGFELSASSYYYAPSAQEVEASNVQQQKQQQHHMFLLQQQQQQQKQQYYLSLEKSSDLPFVNKKSNISHCVPTLANIGGTKRKAEIVDRQLSSSEPMLKISKADQNRNQNDLPFATYLKNGSNIQTGSSVYQGICQGHGQGLVISVPVVSDMSTNSNSNDDCSSGSGGGSPDATGSDGPGSGSTGSGVLSDEGEGEISDDSGKGVRICKSDGGDGQVQSSFSYKKSDYNKVSNENFKTTNNFRSDYKISPSTSKPINSDFSSVERRNSSDSNSVSTGGQDMSPSHSNSMGANISINVNVNVNEKVTAHDEALLSMMSFFSHCHKVENEKEI